MYVHVCSRVWVWTVHGLRSCQFGFISVFRVCQDVSSDNVGPQNMSFEGVASLLAVRFQTAAFDAWQHIRTSRDRLTVTSDHSSCDTIATNCNVNLLFCFWSKAFVLRGLLPFLKWLFRVRAWRWYGQKQTDVSFSLSKCVHGVTAVDLSHRRNLVLPMRALCKVCFCTLICAWLLTWGCATLYQLHDRMTWHKVASFLSWKAQMLYDVVWRLFHRFSSTPLAIGAISMTLRTPANALITDMYSLSKKGKKGKNHEILPNSCQVSDLFFLGAIRII